MTGRPSRKLLFLRSSSPIIRTCRTTHGVIDAEALSRRVGTGHIYELPGWSERGPDGAIAA